MIFMADNKQRKLTEAERVRLDRFNATCADLAEQGYRRTDLRISMFWANVGAIVVFLVLAAIFLPVFHMLHPNAQMLVNGVGLFLIFAVVFALTVVHELIHGFTWSRFTPNGFKVIEFGIMWNALAPYCTCGVPLQKGPYILGALMPLITLGIIPLVVALVIGSAPLLYIAIFMVDAALGDIMIVREILRYKPTSDDVLLYDHPTEAGSVIFER